jgi:hypothetical protein
MDWASKTATFGDRMNNGRVIVSPRWTKPELCAAGTRAEIILSAHCSTPASVFLKSDAERYELAVAGGVAALVPGFQRLVVPIPSTVAAGLYDLQIQDEKGEVAFEPHSVWVAKPARAGFVCAHVSDLHISRSSKKNPGDQSKQVEALIDFIAGEVKPDFILNTGDLVTRYGLGGKPLPRENVADQMHRAREIILRHRIPHFLSPGNHDVAFPYIKEDWLRLMGGSWEEGGDNYSFDYGGIRFINLDRSVEYDTNHEMINSRFHPFQHGWLRTELESIPAGDKAVIFCHYDYSRELQLYLSQYPVLKVLYGHSNTPCLSPEFSTLDGGLRTPNNYQVVTYSAAEGLRVISKIAPLEIIRDET